MELADSPICLPATRNLQISYIQRELKASPAFYKDGRPNTLPFDHTVTPVLGAGTVETFMAHEVS